MYRLARTLRLMLVLAALAAFATGLLAQAPAAAPAGTDAAASAAQTQPAATPVAETAAPAAEHKGGGEANLVLPDLRQAQFLGGMNGHTLLLGGLVVSGLGMLFGLIIYVRLRKMPVHKAMREVSELIYETCKTYLTTQGKFLLLLECFIGSIIVLYFGFLYQGGVGAFKVAIIVLFSLVGISGSFLVAAFGMRVNTFANSRAAFASLTGKAFPCYEIPLRAGMSIGMLLVSVEL
ncbi:MAG: sodium/proton-translocating pyrophosphatase, partial [Bryobacteraceae bacterium]